MSGPLGRGVITLVLGGLAVVAAASSALAAAQVRVTDDGFIPSTVRVHEGEAVTWLNDSDHEVTIVGEDGSWDSGRLEPGETFTVTMRGTGEVLYGTEDGALVGAIVVEEASAEPADDPGPEAEAEQPGEAGADTAEDGDVLDEDAEQDVADAQDERDRDSQGDDGAPALADTGASWLLLGGVAAGLAGAGGGLLRTASRRAAPRPG